MTHNQVSQSPNQQILAKQNKFILEKFQLRNFLAHGLTPLSFLSVVKEPDYSRLKKCETLCEHTLTILTIHLRILSHKLVIN